MSQGPQRFLSYFLLLSFAIPTICRNYALALEPNQVFAKVASSVVIVEGIPAKKGDPYSLGSGILVAPGTVVTNCHVVTQAKYLRVRQGKKITAADLQFADRERDLCQLNLRIAGLFTTSISEIVPIGRLEIGQRVYAIGAPHGLELTFTEGLISSIREYKGNQIVQTSAPISHGSSGGGLFDTKGRLVGITSFIVEDAQNLNFAYPATYLTEIQARHIASERAKYDNNLVDSYSRLIASLIHRKVEWAETKDSDLVVSFIITLTPNGDVVKIEKRDASHNLDYDKAIERAVLAAKPFPLPKEAQLAAAFHQVIIAFAPDEKGGAAPLSRPLEDAAAPLSNLPSINDLPSINEGGGFQPAPDYKKK